MDFIDLTQFVKELSSLSGVNPQLQVVRAYSSQEGLVLCLEFFPKLGRVLFGLNTENPERFILLGGAKPSLASVNAPLQLYLKAHFQNQRCVKAHFEPADGKAVLSFMPGNREWILSFHQRAKAFELHSELRVPGKKPYFQNIRLGPFPASLVKGGSLGSVPLTSGIEQNSELVVLQSADDSLLSQKVGLAFTAPKAVEKKRTRLLENVQADLSRAEAWLRDFAEVCRVLETSPQAWESSLNFPVHVQILLQKEIDEGRLPPWGSQSVALANEKIFSERRRQLRKVEGARKRLAEVQREIEKTSSLTASSALAEAIKDSSQKTSHRSSESKHSEKIKNKKLGIRVILTGEIEARVGRSASENAELFRQAKDRDLWFHVRGQAGGHVWVSRGQKGFGAKDEPSQSLLQEGAQLALYNSKARSSGSAFVDYTERRHLRSIKGAVGAVEILRSQTRHVSLDPAFESLIKGK